MNKLREIFTASTNSKIYQQGLALLDKAYKEERCDTCIHNIPIDLYLPGYITDGPKCKLGGTCLERCGDSVHCIDFKQKEKPMMVRSYE